MPSVQIFSQAVPKPEEILGFEVGPDYHLATHTQAISYLRILVKNSDKVRLFDMGKTSMGQTITYAAISSAEKRLCLPLLQIKKRRALLNTPKKTL